MSGARIMQRLGATISKKYEIEIGAGISEIGSEKSSVRSLSQVITGSYRF
jgi:hypothetical protein